jgi:hydrogenase maturation protein HypF
LSTYGTASSGVVAPDDGSTTSAVEVIVRGVVQGVGFRPFVHRLAIREGLDGWVRNEAGAVRILAQGRSAAIAALLDGLRDDLPPLARLDELDVHRRESEPLSGFRVLASDASPIGRLPVSPDVAVCAACEAELCDATNRRFRYPFITCTDCGPRFTVIESMPYDRERSTMRAFPQCPACRAEYDDPADRRYHSETNSCSDCGPTLWFAPAGSPRAGTGDHGADDHGMERALGIAQATTGDAALAAGARLLLDGGVLALRGLGGFHLAVDATRHQAVHELRKRKHRNEKPLAVMVRSLEDASRVAVVTPVEAALIASRERPIVVVRRREDGPVAEDIAPGLDSVGVMLAYTPLHRLLLDEVGGRPLVMTSGNESEEPIAIGNAEARRRLGSIADGFLLHDREIVARYDDSLVRVVGDRTLLLRRSRGYAPIPIPLPVPARVPILATGPHLKNTFTIAEGSDAYVSQHVGDLENLETLEHFADARGRFETLFRIRPERVVRDLHPGYLSTRLAEESGLPELEPVQHHHAHVAAVLGEHGVVEPAIGIALDGTGYGDDGTVWGCEMLLADLTCCTRLAHLRDAPLPGGDRAARSPWRALLGFASLDERSDWADRALAAVDPAELSVARLQIRRGLNAPPASSMGRLFDAAAAVLCLRLEAAYEGQAAMELEAAAGAVEAAPLPFPRVARPDGATLLDPVPLLRALAEGRAQGTPLEELAAGFHEGVASAVAALADDLCAHEEIDRVVLAGGCFQNARLLSCVEARLRDRGREVLTPRALGPNDGAISYGQAVVAAARMTSD